MSPPNRLFLELSITRPVYIHLFGLRAYPTHEDFLHSCFTPFARHFIFYTAFSRGLVVSRWNVLIRTDMVFNSPLGTASDVTPVALAHLTYTSSIHGSYPEKSWKFGFYSERFFASHQHWLWFLRFFLGLRHRAIHCFPSSGALLHFPFRPRASSTSRSSRLFSYDIEVANSELHDYLVLLLKA